MKKLIFILLLSSMSAIAQPPPHSHAGGNGNGNSPNSGNNPAHAVPISGIWILLIAGIGFGIYQLHLKKQYGTKNK
jgi:hypothetical protein